MGNVISHSQQYRDAFYSLALTSAVCEEHKEKVETIEKQLKAFPQISWEHSESMVKRGQKSLTNEESAS